jgi:hypothetical protein
MVKEQHAINEKPDVIRETDSENNVTVMET